MTCFLYLETQVQLAASIEETFGELIVGLNTDNLIRILTRQLRLILLSSDSQNEYALFLHARAPYELTCSQLVIRSRRTIALVCSVVRQPPFEQPGAAKGVRVSSSAMTSLPTAAA